MRARLAGWLLLAQLLSSCDVLTFSCTEAGCIEGLLVFVSSMSGTSWPPGQYEMAFMAEGGTSHTCTATVPPLSADAPPLSNTLNCVPTLGTAFFQHAIWCSQPGGAGASGDGCRAHTSFNASFEDRQASRSRSR